MCMSSQQRVSHNTVNQEQPKEDESVDYLENEYVTEEGSEINTRVNDDGVEEEQCPTCGNWYQNIGQHWGYPTVDCGHPPISQYKYELAIGFLMGDGNISKNSTNNNVLEITNTNKSMIDWIFQKFGWLSSSLQKRTSNYSANCVNETNLGYENYNAEAQDYFDTYTIKTRAHPVFNKLREWYKEDGLVFQEVEYTPTILRMWYISDGCNNLSNNDIQLTSCNESERPSVIIQCFNDVGIDISNGNNHKHFRIGKDKDKFFDYIGHDPVPGFEYKWADTREEYERLKKQCKSKHKTQTMED